MREILFRGQTRRYGEKVRMGDGQKLPSRWVYGGVLQGGGSHSIIYGGENENNPGEGLDKWVVYTDTLGQFTGLTDKNGKKIFEGDILKFHANFKTSVIGKVIFECGTFAFEYTDIAHGIDLEWFSFSDDEIAPPEHCMEVIGNIHDNDLEDFNGN